MVDTYDCPRRPKFPSFLVIGAAKSGTFTLNRYFSSHPQVFMCRTKEPHFFAFGGQGLKFEAPGRPVHSWVDSLDKYLALFKAGKSALTAGECSVSYLYWPGTAERIHRFNPHMKLIVSLRDPVDRAYSSFNYAKSYGMEPLASLLDGFAAEPQRIEENRSILLRYRDLGLYARQLKRFYGVFPRDQIKVVLFDRLVQNPFRTISALYDFIGVRSSIEVNRTVWMNVTKVPDDSNPLHRFVNSEKMARKTVRRLLPVPARRGIRNLTRQLLFRRPGPLPAEVRCRLRQLFRDDIQKLEQLIDVDLSAWLA